eukprot:Em0012g724a
MVAADRHCKREILKLEKELPKWRTALDAGNNPEFGSDVLAILKGKVAEFLMITRTVSLGRKSAISDVDLTCHWRVLRSKCLENRPLLH